MKTGNYFSLSFTTPPSGRPIAESKMPLHEAYCIRNVIRCPKCNDPVDKSELEQHQNEAHKLVIPFTNPYNPVQAACKYCKKDFEVRILNNHQETCTKKPRFCEFCNCDVEADLYANHKYQCGSRTKKCPHCNKNIMIRGKFSEIENNESKNSMPTSLPVKLVRKTMRLPSLL